MASFLESGFLDARRGRPRASVHSQRPRYERRRPRGRAQWASSNSKHPSKASPPHHSAEDRSARAAVTKARTRREPALKGAMAVSSPACYSETPPSLCTAPVEVATWTHVLFPTHNDETASEQQQRPGALDAGGAHHHWTCSRSSTIEVAPRDDGADVLEIEPWARRRLDAGSTLARRWLDAGSTQLDANWTLVVCDHALWRQAEARRHSTPLDATRRWLDAARRWPNAHQGLIFRP